MVTKSCRAWRLALGGKRWTFIVLLSAPSPCSQCKPIFCQKFRNGQDLQRAHVRMCQLRKDSHSIACRRTDVDMFCKDCQVVQDECEGVPWKTEQKKREDKDEKKKRSWRTKRKLIRRKMTIGREEVENLAGQNAEQPRQSKSKCSSAWKGFEGGRRSSASHMHSVHFPMDKVGYTSESPRGKTSTACRWLAP